MKTLPKVFALAVVAVATLLAPLSLPAATHLMENLGRGVVALRTADTESFVSWRMLGTDPDEVAFNVYRQAGAATPVLVNAAPLAAPSTVVPLPQGFLSPSLAEFGLRSV
ncbi:MAG TPA: hypothetical protein VHN79_07105, partial [Lacunisphaera sp.]|nr:hypothetical protein [Lacunisphaera sp.]